MRLRPRASVPALLLPLALGLTGCGGDDQPAPAASATSDAEPAPAPAAPTDLEPAGTAADAATDADDLGALTEGFEEALGDSTLDSIAYAIDVALDSIDGYEIDGDAITLLADEGSPGSSSVCIIASTVLGSFTVPDGTTVTVEYPDGTEECAV